MSQPQQKQHNTYLTGYTPSSTVHHEWRTAQNSAQYLLPTLTQMANHNPHLTLLDIGAGSGTITTSLASFMPQGKVIAVDISEEILQKAKRHADDVGAGNVEIRQASVYELPFEDGTFDVVHASQVLAHLDEPKRAVREMIRVAKKPGGVVAMRESDLRAWSVYPEYPGLLAMNKMFCAVQEANGGHVNAGTQLVSWVLAEGLKREQIMASAGTWCYSTPEERQLWAETMADRCVNGTMPKKAIEIGVAKEEELREMSEAWGKWMRAEDGCCIFTLSLCVFTAIHLNVGPEGETTLQWWIRKHERQKLYEKPVGPGLSKTLSFGEDDIGRFITREIMLYTAGKQWFSASRLCKKLTKSGIGVPGEMFEAPTIRSAPFWSRSEAPAKAAPLHRDRPQTYSLRYGYYAVMGGFIVDVSHLHSTYSRLTISPKGVAFLAKHGHVLKIPESTIRDKSKADMLAKTLVIIQVSWMLIQTISRRCVGYPITLLEVHTLVHVAIAIAMYGLWFLKPMDIRDPTWVDSREFEDLLALMLVRNYGFGSKARTASGEGPPVPIKAAHHKYSNGSESAYLLYYGEPAEGQDMVDQATKVTASELRESVQSDATTRVLPQTAAALTPDIVQHRQLGSGSDYCIADLFFGPPVCTLLSGQALPCGIGPALSVLNRWATEEDYDHDGKLEISITSKDILRWTLAAQALQKIGETLYRDTPTGSANYFTYYAHNIFLDRKGLQAGFYAYFRAWASGGLIAALVICMFYGAAHCTAWNFIFPTPTERLLWRISCVDTVAGVISLLALFSLSVYLHEHQARSLIKAFFTQEPGIMSWVYRMIITIGVLNIPLFILSRIFIIVETFISLRHVQKGVYKTVEWTDYIPHI
ncbi:MAG: hypothetical protein Q9181_000891 [Wetmoreana brouardii]